MTAPRYTVHTRSAGIDTQIGATDDMTEANRMIRKALEDGATYAFQQDTRPGQPIERTEAEREAMAALVNSVKVRTVG